MKKTSHIKSKRKISIKPVVAETIEKPKLIRIKNIRTPIDELFGYIEQYSPIRESKIPVRIKGHGSFQSHVELLESKGLIDIKTPLFSSERTFVFKTKELERYCAGVQLL